MIDCDGYRPNVGIVICNRFGQVLWARRYGQNSWQFPQGGIKPNETAEQAMFRELYEEVGLTPKDVKILSVTNGWLRYKLPKRMVRWENEPVCIGQKQKWFLLELCVDTTALNLNTSSTPEFDDWKWVSFWYPIRQVIAFKREVYRRAMKEFSSVVFARQLVREEPRQNGVAESIFPSKVVKESEQKRHRKKQFTFFAHKRRNKQRTNK